MPQIPGSRALALDAGFVGAYVGGKPLSRDVTASPDRTDAAIVSAVLYASLFDFPLTVRELRASLTVQAPSVDGLRQRLQHSPWLRAHILLRDDFVMPTGRPDLLAVRQRREDRSRAFLATHRRTLRWLCTVPFTRLVAISGSLAHLNADDEADLDLFVAAAEGHVWTVAVGMIVLAKLLRCRRQVCVNYIVAESALSFDQPDRFTASQIRALRPVEGHALLDALVTANPCVSRWFPNGPPAHSFPALDGAHAGLRRLAEWALRPFGIVVEWVCRGAYGRHLNRQRARWTSPDQVRLSPQVLKLHTRSHRSSLLARHRALLSAAGISDPAPGRHRSGVWRGSN